MSWRISGTASTSPVARVGWQHSYVHVDGDERISKVTMEMALKRGQMSIEVAIESSWTSTVSGKPISAKMIQDMSMAKTIAKMDLSA